MKYVNGRDVLPEKLFEEIQNYTQGLYLYIPKKSGSKKNWGDSTYIKKELALRNREIYGKFLEGISFGRIAEKFHLSEKSIRRIILEEKRKMEEKREVIQDVLKEWNLDEVPVAMHHTTWGIGEQYVLKEYTERSTLKRNLTFLRVLKEQNLPVPEVVQTRKGSWYVETAEAMYLLTGRLRGRSLVNSEMLEKPFFVEFGRILGKLHRAFEICDHAMSFWQNSLLEEMSGWIQEGVEKFNPSYVNKEEFQKVLTRLEELYSKLPKQLIHRDVHLGNFLFYEGEFSGYIDFDLSQSNIRIFDLCYFMLGLLIKEDSHFLEEKKWFEILPQVINGYNEVNPLLKDERDAVVVVMKSIEYLFIVYFLSVEDEKRAQDAGNVLHFLERNTDRIEELVR
ncbi:CD3324 family protein [Proteiniclasticum ruminis]|uniref:Phosphotransferase enzyme family protein n=1 Tax=Proteiniclasticum ruminis TaxID=398199 RepID=A0A1I5D4D2_9CLOT|nr:CD3324 family protein [Proteiniclasticum ruminis]SFN94075.1 Phosphotransferase enzyme family protein [Proteiniclasticum ruminis]